MNSPIIRFISLLVLHNMYGIVRGLKNSVPLCDRLITCWYFILCNSAMIALMILPVMFVFAYSQMYSFNSCLGWIFMLTNPTKGYVAIFSQPILSLRNKRTPSQVLSPPDRLLHPLCCEQDFLSKCHPRESRAPWNSLSSLPITTESSLW